MEAAAAKGVERKRDAAARAEEAKERRQAATERFMANRAALKSALEQRGAAEAERCATAEAKRTRTMNASVEKVRGEERSPRFAPLHPSAFRPPNPFLSLSSASAPWLDPFITSRSPCRFAFRPIRFRPFLESLPPLPRRPLARPLGGAHCAMHTSRRPSSSAPSTYR